MKKAIFALIFLTFSANVYASLNTGTRPNRVNPEVTNSNTLSCPHKSSAGRFGNTNPAVKVAKAAAPSGLKGRQ